MNKDYLRSNILGKNNNFKSEIIIYDSQEYEIRQPTIGIRGKIIAHASDKSGELDKSKLIAWLAIYCVFVPNSDIKVFENTDVSGLINQPVGSFLDIFQTKLLDLIVIDFDVKKKT